MSRQATRRCAIASFPALAALLFSAPALAALLLSAPAPAALLSSAPALAGGTIVLQERKPAVMLVVVPKEVSSAASSSVYLDAAARAFRAHTGLFLQSVEQAGFDSEKLAACPRATRMTCWILSIRPDYATGAPPASLTRELFVLNVLPLETRKERISTLLIDTDEALRCYRDIDRTLGDWEAKVEDCIYVTAAHGPPEVIDPTDRRAIDRDFKALVTDRYRVFLDARGLYEPFGRIAIQSAAAGEEIRLEGTTIGRTTPPITRLVDVTPGQRRLLVTRSGDAPFEIEIGVSRGRTSTASVPLSAAVQTRSPPHQVLFWSGAGMAAAATVLAAVSIDKSQKVESRCFVSGAGDGSACRGLGYPRFGLSRSELPTADRDRVNPGGVPILPLAIGLFAAGATWIAVESIGEPKSDQPWLEILAGLGAGGLSYGAAIAFGPK